jgi:uncharacterized protein
LIADVGSRISMRKKHSSAAFFRLLWTNEDNQQFDKKIMTNHLASERSPYLRHAANQPVDWRPWSDEAFDLARRDDKPVFLSTGAVWCHWCHVMAKETFLDEEVARLMNELFVCIKLDRDERPDIDQRFQQAVSAMGSGSGWPLSVFLTPERKPFFGGTYFPPEDRHGRPGFKSVLRSVSGFYRSHRGEVEDFADRLRDALKPDTVKPGELRKQAITDAVATVLTHYDPKNGGFGASPKFPMPGALEFLIRRYPLMQDGLFVGLAVRKTLESMARGGFHDQLGGGFHRYSVDDAWIVPHFEKMADDNAWLLRNYIDAYSLFGDVRFKDVAEGIIRFSREVLSDPAGGFFASQDADVTPDDEGGYFTWSDDEFRAVLTAEEHAVLSRHLLDPRGAMHHDRSRQVLFVSREPQESAQELAMLPAAVERIIARGKEKLLHARNARPAPFIDRTLYTSLNGMYITSCLRAHRVLDDRWLKEFSLMSLARILQQHYGGAQLLHTAGIPGVLDDHVHLVEALIEAYEATGDARHLSQAQELMQLTLATFQDSEGGFFDTGQEVLGTRLKRIDDIPHPSANSTAAMLLLKLHRLTGEDRYLDAAGRALSLFASAAAEIGVHAGAYYGGLDAWFHLLMLTVEAPPESILARAARKFAGAYVVIRYGGDHGRVIPCIGTLCGEPITDPGALSQSVGKLQKQDT